MRAWTEPGLRTSLDPRTLLFLWSCGTLLLILSGRVALLAGELAVLTGAVVGLGLGRRWLANLRLIALLAGVVFLISLVAFDLEIALVTSLRLAALVSLSFLVFQAVSAEELGAALVHLGAPYALAFIITTSLQFVPVVGRMMGDIRDAQRARGIDLDAGLRALPRYPALLVPLLVRAFLLAEELAQAMESRGFGRRGRSSVRELRLRARDGLAMALGLTGLVVGILARAYV